MTVRRKIACILIAFIALMFAAVLLLFRVVLQKNVDLLEESRVRDNIARAANVLDNETALLDRFTHDYSAWDEAYRFVQNPWPAFIKSNLPISAFTINDCDFMVFLNSVGNIVCQKSYDLRTGREIPIPAGMLAHLVPGSPLLRLAAEDSSVRGYIVLPEGIFMVVSRPVLTSEEEGSIRGALVTGRKFNQRYVDRLSSIIRLPLVLKGPESASPGSEPPVGPSGAVRSVRFLDDHTAEGSIPFMDVMGNRAFALVFRQERAVHGQFLRLRNYSLTILVLFDDEEKAVFQFMSSQVAMAIDRVRARERLQASLREKEALLREVHHRVKNNMQIISSIFNLQAGEIRDPRAIDKIREGQARIRSMALIHEKLYQSEDLARINLADYIRSLAAHLFHFWKVGGDRIRLETDLQDATLDTNTAIPCGLIINELLSNALEHAFPDGRTGTVRLSLRRDPDGGFAIQIHDDGIGLPAGVEPGRSNTLGLQIVELLTRQLNGTLAIDRTAGTSFSIRFRKLPYKPRI